MFYSNLFIIYLSFGFVKSQDNRPSFEMMNSVSSGGTFVPATFSQKFYQSESEVCTKDFNPTRYNFHRCIKGIWLQYKETNFTEMNDYIGTQSCNYILGPVPKSIRVIGSPTNYRESTATFFDQKGFIGEPFMYTEDEPDFGQFGNVPRSIILTGDRNLILYLGANYEGYSIKITRTPPVNFMLDVESTYEIPPEAIKSFQFIDV